MRWSSALAISRQHVKALEAGSTEAAAAAEALYRLAHVNAADRDAIADAGAIAPLVALLTNGTAGGQNHAVRALANLVRYGLH